MKKIYFDITILDDFKAYKEYELGIQQLKMLGFLIKNGEIIVERRPVNTTPVVLHTLVEGDSFNKFRDHWLDLLKN